MKNRNQIKSKKSYLGNRVPPEFVSVAEPNEELSAMQKKSKKCHIYSYLVGK